MLDLSNILTVGIMVTYISNKIAQNLTHTYTQVQIKLGILNKVSGLYQCHYPGYDILEFCKMTIGGN